MRFDNVFKLMVILNHSRMPIIDGFETTKRLRLIEKNPSETHTELSSRLSKSIHGRVPVFAVSASLKEYQRQTMLSSGMNGWLLKPINFKRLKEILSGIMDPVQRTRDIYQPGYTWENGGWLD